MNRYRMALPLWLCFGLVVLMVGTARVVSGVGGVSEVEMRGDSGWGEEVGGRFTATQSITLPKGLAIYYGWPSLVNGAGGDVDLAVQAFAGFEVLVLGDGLEHASHGDHAKTRQIVTQLINSGVEVYGYVDMGVTTQNLPITTAQQYVDEWNDMGVTGIFWDDAGYDYGVDRARQNTLIDYTHAQGLKVFINAWNPDDLFAHEVVSASSHLQAGDWYLAESHPVANGQFADLGFWWHKSQALDGYRAQTGVKIATISTGSDENTGWANQATFRQALWATYLFGFDAFGFTNPQYSASGSAANRLRALPRVATDIGTTYLGAPQTTEVVTTTNIPPQTTEVVTTTHVYTRATDKGTILVFGDATSGGGTFRGGACDTTSLGNRIWPTCAASPPAQSSSFGPRQKASESFRYDWHRGVDIPQPLGDPLYATMDGVVRIAGTHPAYSDMLVQIRHREQPPYLYSNYLHMKSVVVSEGHLLTVGDLIGYSGESATPNRPPPPAPPPILREGGKESTKAAKTSFFSPLSRSVPTLSIGPEESRKVPNSSFFSRLSLPSPSIGGGVGGGGRDGGLGFDHLHFEFREGCVYQECNRHPWGYLPYSDTLPLTPTLSGANLSGTQALLLLDIESAPDQLDLDGLGLSWGSQTIQLSFNDINGTTQRDFPYLLDHPLVTLNDGVETCLFPAKFNTSSSQVGYRVGFRHLEMGATTGSAATRDLNRTGPALPLAPQASALTLTPASQQLVRQAGQSLSFDHSLQNNGTEPLSLTLSAQSSQNNALRLSHNHLRLAPGSQQQITLTVTLSADFPVGVGDCILLEAHAGTGPPVIALNSLLTTPNMIFLPLIMQP